MSINDKNCASCPSALTVHEAQSFFGDSSIKTPMCARFGFLLAEPKNNIIAAGVDDKVGDYYASSCNSFGESRPTAPTGKFTPVLFEPDPVALSTYGPADDSVKSCTNCVNFFVSDEHGVYGCKAKTIVVLQSRVNIEPQGCVWAQETAVAVSRVKGSPVQIPFSAAYVKMAPAKPTTKVSKAGNGSWVDPLTYVSDVPVTGTQVFTSIASIPKHMQGSITITAQGTYEVPLDLILRAWRKVELKSGKVEYLPIFRTEWFSEEDQRLIPRAGDDNGDPSLYHDYSGLLEKFLIVVYKRDMPLCMVGEPGSGKTEGGRWLAAIMNMPFHRFSFNEFSEPEQFLGQMELRSGETVFIPKELPNAWVKSGLGLSDEFNLPMEGIVQIFRSMFDNSRELKLFGNTYTRDPFHFHLLAINPSWDARNIGAKELASADVRRLKYHKMPYPDEEMQKGIIRETLKKLADEALPTATITAIIKASADLREMSRQGKIPHHWTISQDVAVALLSLDMTLEEAYNTAYFDYIDPATASTAMQTIRNRFPNGV